MRRHAVVAVLVFVALSAIAQTSQTAQISSSSDSTALSFAQKSVAALTRGVSVSDVTLNANVISILGTDNETGTATLMAKGLAESLITLNLSGGTRSDVRNVSNGTSAGAWQKNGGIATQYAQHNCWTDAAWFFPALSSLTQTGNPNFMFKYIGQEQHGGAAVQHIRVLQYVSQGLPPVSTTDFYLDVNSYLPLAIAPILYADGDMNTTIPNEVRFAQYQLVSGVQVPFHFQRMLNGLVVLDATVTSATINTGLSDSFFALQ